MANETQLNKELVGGNATVINRTFQQNGSATVINPIAAGTSDLSLGQVLCGKYSVVKKMDIVTGEADLYLVEYNNVQYVAKIYRRKVAIKPEISQKLMNIKSKYVATIYETGEVNGFPMEIIPYYRYGSLQGRKYTYEQLKNDVIPSLNEGLKVLHDNGILHKDLKPSNIMVGDNLKDVAIIDFGISSAREDNNTIIVTKTGMTPEYSAPETFRNLFLEESDYYSLGITLYELFCGYTPYNNMEQEAIEQYISVQRIPFPDNMPEDLQNLISACGILSGFFKGCNPELAGFCIDAEEEATRINGRDDMIFWKLLYKLSPNTTDFYWKGRAYQGLPALGREILEKLWKNDTSSDSYYYEILEEKMLSNYVAIKADKNNALADAVKGLEDGHKMADTGRTKKKNLYLMAYMLSGQKLMHFDGKEFRTVGEFADYMKELLDESYEKFEAMCHKLIDYEDNLDVQFESWLLALGKKKELNSWREGLKN